MAKHQSSKPQKQSKLKPFILRQLQSWLPIAGGYALYCLVPLTITQAAGVVLLPLAAMLIGIVYVVSNDVYSATQVYVNAHSDITIELLEQANHANRRVTKTIYATLSVWLLAGLGLFDIPYFKNHHWYQLIVYIAVYTSALNALYICWLATNLVHTIRTNCIAVEKIKISRNTATSSDSLRCDTATERVSK